ncbi:MAG: YgjV family protein [Firmicutes bacterium]|nr:YgjV family protein [Bacillota bacterium]
MIHIIANGFGVLSTLCFIASFQVKTNKGLYVIQSGANVFYGIQFYLLGAYGGLFNMGMQIVRNLLLCKIDDWKWLRWKGMAPLLCVPSLIYMIATWSGPLDILPFIAMTVGTLGYWTNSAKKLRLAELFCVAPAWMSYDLIAGAYGGVLNELVILASIVFSIIRFGWKGLDDPSFAGKGELKCQA